MEKENIPILSRDELFEQDKKGIHIVQRPFIAQKNVLTCCAERCHRRFKTLEKPINCKPTVIQLMIPVGAVIVKADTIDPIYYRANKAIFEKVVETKSLIQEINNDEVKMKPNECAFLSWYDKSFRYKLGEQMVPKNKFSDDYTYWDRPGIHFVMKQEDNK